MILSTQVAYNSELNPLFKLHPSIYSPLSAAWEDYVLITYIMYELAKGDKSEWHCMFDLWPKQVDVFYVWKDTELMEIQSQRVLKDALHENKCLRQSWENMAEVLNIYPLLFPKEFANYENYLWLWALLASRIFNTYISTTAFTPHAEFVNHENVSTHYKTCIEEDADKIEKKILPEEVSSGVDSSFDVDERYAKPLDKNDGIKLKIDINTGTEFNPNQEIPKIESHLTDKTYTQEETKALDKIKNKFKNDKPHVQILKTDHQVYEEGSQIYMSYGNHGSMYFLGKYGFCFPYNKYDYATVEVNQLKALPNYDKLCSVFKKVFKTGDPIEDKGFKIYYQKLSTQLIDFAKIMLGFNEKKIEVHNNYKDEINAIDKAVSILEHELSAFPTTVEQDTALLPIAKEENTRKWFSIQARINVKNILIHQINLLNILRIIIQNIEAGACDKATILKKTSKEDNESNFNIKVNRRMMNKYFKKHGIDLIE